MIAALLIAAMATPQECTRIGPLYWEIGDAAGTREYGIHGSTVHSESVLPAEAATVWLFAAYVVQARPMKEADRDALRMTSGYTQMTKKGCDQTPTVASCMERAGGFVQADAGRFFYNGAHLQHWAAASGLGSATARQLERKLRAVLHLPLEMRLPQPAAGAWISASSYALFLRRLLKRQLKLAALLGKDPVGEEAVSSPAPKSWRYSYGHWLEDDGSYSSPGSFGFYPWISGKTYGVVARRSTSRQAYSESIECGRALRKAFAAEHR
jgi:hypothetical protein